MCAFHDICIYSVSLRKHQCGTILIICLDSIACYSHISIHLQQLFSIKLTKYSISKNTCFNIHTKLYFVSKGGVLLENISFGKKKSPLLCIESFYWTLVYHLCCYQPLFFTIKTTPYNMYMY